jgi:hypothetical protein
VTRILKNSDEPPFIQGPIRRADFRFHTGLYPPEILLLLSNKHTIAEGHRDDFFQALEYSAKEYALKRHEEELQPSHPVTRRTFKATAGQAKRLKSKIERLKPELMNLYNLAYRDLYDELDARFKSFRFPELIPERSRLEKIGAGSIGNQREDGSIECWYITPEEIKNSLSLLELICETAVQNLPENSGKRSESAMAHWVYFMSEFWVKKLGRPYTVVAHKKENEKGSQPISKVGGFLSDCLEYLDPPAIAKLPWQMRLYNERILNL